MAPAPADEPDGGGGSDQFSPPGSSTYASNTMHVGDGTWDFSKNTFLLPNLMGLNFETMRYNGMGNRFSTIPQYHSLILGHGVIAAITFLFIIPCAVFMARYWTHRPGTAIRYHIYLQILAVGLSTVVFALGFFAVGPPRNLTNPHHGIGVAIYVMILCQAVGGRLIKKIKKGKSFRKHLHRWGGRIIGVLGVIQVPLGLTLYGSPKYCFILYAVWMGFLVVLFFVLDYRDYGRGGVGGDGYVERVEVKEKKDGGKMKWLGPLAAGAGAIALMRGRSQKSKVTDTERGLSRSRSRSRSPGTEYTRTDFTRSEYTRGPATTVMTDSYYDDKHAPSRKSTAGPSGGGGGGFFSKLMGAGAGIGAGALAAKMMKRGNSRRNDDYSAVSTETPSRVRGRGARSDFTESDYTEFTEDMRRKPSTGDRARSPILPAPNPVAAAAAISASGPRRVVTPPRRSAAGNSRLASTVEPSDYSSYVSPSRRGTESRRKSSSAAPGKGFLAGIGLGWLASRMGGGGNKQDQREQQRLRDEEERRRDEEEDDRRYGRRKSRRDSYPSPTRERSRRRLQRPPPQPSAVTGTTMTQTTMTGTSVFSDESSIEPRGNTPYEPAPPGIRPVPAGAGAPPPPGAHGNAPPAPGGLSSDRVSKPPMPPDPHGFLRQESESDARSSPPRRRRYRDGEAAAAAAIATASVLAAQEEEERRRRGTPAASVQLRIDPERSNNYTLRRLTDEEVREQQRRRQNDSVSSGSETDTPTTRRYRRERDRARTRSSSQRRAETTAEQRVEQGVPQQGATPPGVFPGEPLVAPNPAFAAGARRQQGGKDSAYYSGPAQPAGPSGVGGGLGPDPTRSTLADNTTVTGHTAGGVANTVSGMESLTTVESAADRRRARRRLERRDGSRQPPSSVDY
ncbi:hypothetical protein QBC38DRAFT_382888 [Podospora fimiseda]|uniref:Cytochrome b561 domain-containing protein n=1 Tax=Podospora fimiseda TaxID=252190 RepID=A0AAN7BW89_9PEZI|nr:hypothetical protein QBC38DRAFT_382888 [Podospora fimiseda]